MTPQLDSMIKDFILSLYHHTNFFRDILEAVIKKEEKKLRKLETVIQRLKARRNYKTKELEEAKANLRAFRVNSFSWFI